MNEKKIKEWSKELALREKEVWGIQTLRCVIRVQFDSVQLPLAQREEREEDGMDLSVISIYSGASPILALADYRRKSKRPLVVQFVPSADALDMILSTTLYMAIPLKLYPPTPGNGLYAPNVAVLQDGKGQWFKKTDHFKCGVLSLPGTQKAQITAEGLFKTKRDNTRAESQIKKLFSLAKEWEHDTVIIGEWSCEGRDGPIDVIPRLFADHLEMYQWTRYFKSIVFLTHSSKTRDQFHLCLQAKARE